MTKKELKNINKDVKYLMKISKCTKINAILALVKHGKIPAPLKPYEIASILDVSTKKVQHLECTAVYRLQKETRKISKAQDIQTLLEELIHTCSIEGGHYAIRY